ncbi:1,4-alpha-glucan branching protein GlgB [Cumulibacter manganitolerans]|uniref:1,4-alpha-glucan branching protein GlgB n=1 Tax=Cumulibacter manganitolerans TaxID=1884992 RepID=UPI001297F4EA|nr:1,4-alpha-glucan branching protein GlgB [Cumulibacter manganitolerans]
MSTQKPAPTVDPADVARLLAGTHHSPHSFLGAHPVDDKHVVVRAYYPHATAVEVIAEGTRARTPMRRLADEGLYGAVLEGGVPDYQLEVTYEDGNSHVVDDPYRWFPTLGELDCHLISEGRHERLWDVLGAHVRRYDTAHGTVEGVSFAVWAPNARGVTVQGDFDHWSGRQYPLRSIGSTGVWELFIPGVAPDAYYKLLVTGPDGTAREKADPFAFATDVPPSWASRVHHSTHEWADAAWLERRAQTAWHAAPMSIYELHLGSWRKGLSYREIADQLVDYLGQTGFTHVEMMPVAEHPFGGSWGYQVSSYYAPSARFGSPDDLKYLIDRLHQAGYGVIIDWVPAHFPKDAWALARFDGTPLYEHADPLRGEHPDWGTYVFDFGRREVRNFLVANALFWGEEYHVDGLRVDAVASMLYLDYSREEGQWRPNEYGGRENLDAVAFLQEVNATIYKRVPGIITIAEESTSWPGVTRPAHLGGLGFGFKWNMGWMNDSLRYIEKDPVHRAYHHNELTFSMVYAYSENYILPISHDEVVHGKGSLVRKMPGDRWQQLANVRAFLAYMWAHPGKNLLFMGSEIGQDAEWAEGRSIDWWLLEDPAHAGIQRLVSDLNARYRDLPALWQRDNDPGGFGWIDANDSGNNVLSFLRYDADGDALACVVNFAGHPHHGYRIGLPSPGTWREVLNTDAVEYGGSGLGNLGSVDASDEPWHGLPASASLSVPPLGAVWFRLES